MHTDASQSVGKVHIDVVDLGVDFLTVAGHKRETLSPPFPLQGGLRSFLVGE